MICRSLPITVAPTSGHTAMRPISKPNSVVLPGTNDYRLMAPEALRSVNLAMRRV